MHNHSEIDDLYNDITNNIIIEPINQSYYTYMNYTNTYINEIYSIYTDNFILESNSNTHNSNVEIISPIDVLNNDIEDDESTNYDDMPPLVNDYDNDLYDSIPPLVDDSDNDSYNSMPLLIDDYDNNSYDSMPPLISINNTFYWDMNTFTYDSDDDLNNVIERYLE
jgi:hypothetical protein